jgi:hypothetical protein
MRAGGGTTSGNFGFTSLGSSAAYNTFVDGAIGGKIRNTVDSIGEVAFRGTLSGNNGYKGRTDARSNEGQSFLNAPYSGWSFLGGAGCSADTLAPATDVWGTFEVQVAGSTFKFYRDGILRRACTDAAYSAAGEIALQNYYGSYTDYDDIYVRKFVAVEPTYSLGTGATAVTLAGGPTLIANVTPPGTPVFSQTGKVITIDITTAQNGETVHMRTKVRPRNL